MAITTKQQRQQRRSEALQLIVDGVPPTDAATQLSSKWGCSRRTARRITAKAMDLVHRDLEAVDIQNPQLASVLIHSLMEVAAKGRETGQLGASVAALRELAAMCGVGKHNMNHRGYWRP